MSLGICICGRQFYRIPDSFSVTVTDEHKMFIWRCLCGLQVALPHTDELEKQIHERAEKEAMQDACMHDDVSSSRICYDCDKDLTEDWADDFYDQARDLEML